MKKEIGRISKDNITLIEYGSLDGSVVDNYFIQCGVMGFFASKEELANLFLVLNYYLHIDDFAECKLKVGDEDVAIS